ncbi:trans-aconitate methyltransferase [Methanomicrobium sp. W14]|uniref:class I SAM-dependent methyltransferase n=1 Tax=Methanomicrobium sp. W14 TaxID=2817839 RepID=UPI001AE3EF8A|nr:class I SAM-dependent methyltransferase [Methanomicrobium sp. W14]MBP2134190.1 trans-aconitate methyltransferase [Methanomicrobium sp. W14]
MSSREGFGSFTWNASDYCKNSPAQKKWGNELIEKLGLNGSERLLDIGCGDGTLTAEISRLLPKGQDRLIHVRMARLEAKAKKPEK